MGKYEVTQDQWQAVMGSNPSEYKNCGGNCPVDSVSWEAIQLFIGRLNDRHDGHSYRLPTEAEWEYAAGAGAAGTPTGNLDDVAWYDGNSGGQTHPVGQKKPNAWGLYDMLGNVWEWCQDRYDQNYYRISPSNDPQGPSDGQTRELRGGGVWDAKDACRVARRSKGFSPDAHIADMGFRVVMVQ